MVYGVGKEEMVDVFCDVVANPPSFDFQVSKNLMSICLCGHYLVYISFSTFQWSFNNSADFMVVPPDRVIKVNGTRSMLTYTPMNNKDYGTLLCSATNEVGRQREPCIFHIILAGKEII